MTPTPRDERSSPPTPIIPDEQAAVARFLAAGHRLEKSRGRYLWVRPNEDRTRGPGAGCVPPRLVVPLIDAGLAERTQPEANVNMVEATQLCIQRYGRPI